MAIHESQRYASRLYIDRRHLLRDLQGVSSGYLSAFLEMENVQTAGGPTVCTLCLFGRLGLFS